jgi:hypothetical protein
MPLYPRQGNPEAFARTKLAARSAAWARTISASVLLRVLVILAIELRITA